MEKAGDILKLFLDKKQLDAAKSYSSFFRSWENIVGENIAAHSEVKDIRNHTVLIEVDHPGWIQMIQINYQRILKAIQIRYPELNVKKIHLRLGSRWQKTGEPEPQKKTDVDAGKDREDEQCRESGIGKILDERLKTALRNLEKRIHDS